jgi:uroporphyrinogen decarboxylase
MNSLERVRAVLARKIPDVVPHALYDVAIDCYNQSTIELFQRKTGKHPRDAFHHDIRGSGMPTRSPGAEWKRQVREMASVDEVHRLMRDWRPTRATVETMASQVNAIHADGKAVQMGTWVSDFETPFTLRGIEQFYVDLGTEEDWLPVFLDYITDASAEDARIAALAGADIFGIGDDLGSQRGLLISPDQWRRLFKPRLKRIIEAVKNNSRTTAFFLHSDGLITEIIPDLIEVGVDILNPIQPEVMDPARIKTDFGKALIFYGAISVQHTLPFGTPDDVMREVKLRMETIGAGGGYIMTPSHLLDEAIPWENIEAFFRAAQTYGKY